MRFKTTALPLLFASFLLQPLNVASAEPTPSGSTRGAALHLTRYAPSPSPGTIKIANTVKRSNCKEGKHAEKCQWSGEPLAEDGSVQPKAEQVLKRVFNFPLSEADAEAIDLPDLLIQVLVHLSNTFEGAQICVVSGYRCWQAGGQQCSTFQKESSRHLTGEAADIVLLGIDNVDLASYLLYLNENHETFRRHLGIGFYPNREHVHVDVRKEPLYYVDSSSSGAPDYDKNKPHPVEAFFLHYDAKVAPSRPGGQCPTVPDSDSLTEGEEFSATSYDVRWKNVLFTEPPLNGSPSSRQQFAGKKLDFTPLKELAGLDQL